MGKQDKRPTCTVCGEFIRPAFEGDNICDTCASAAMFILVDFDESGDTFSLGPRGWSYGTKDATRYATLAEAAAQSLVCERFGAHRPMWVDESKPFCAFEFSKAK